MAAEFALLKPAQQQSLLRQLEYYFSDIAFPFDDYLQGQATDGDDAHQKCAR